MDTCQTIKEDMKIWRKEFDGKILKIGWGGLGLLVLILRTCLTILKHCEKFDKERQE